jgi:hypothetical protein
MQRLMAEQRTLTARARVLRDIASKTREVARLRRELTRATQDLGRLDRLLRSLDREGIGAEPTTRSTSARRLLIEQLVLRRLDRNSPRATPSDELWPLAQAAGVKSRSTFRSQLHRLAQKGSIVSLKAGQWRLAPGVVVPRIVHPDVEAAIKRLQRLT